MVDVDVLSVWGYVRQDDAVAGVCIGWDKVKYLIGVFCLCGVVGECGIQAFTLLWVATGFT